MNTDAHQLVVTARALVVIDAHLLLVTNDESYWYTPGGHVRAGESLHDCVVRELHEETGLSARPERLLHVAEFVETETSEHKVEFYFLMGQPTNNLPAGWIDSRPVSSVRLFDLQELKRITVYPRFLLDGTWLAPHGSDADIYRGLERR